MWREPLTMPHWIRSMLAMIPREGAPGFRFVVCPDTFRAYWNFATRVTDLREHALPMPPIEIADRSGRLMLQGYPVRVWMGMPAGDILFTDVEIPGVLP